MYRAEGGFSSYLYIQEGDSIIAPNGIEAKVVKKIDGNAYDGLPIYSNTSKIYLKKVDGKIVQARIYNNRKPVVDLDWNHEHTNKKSKEKFSDGIVHVHEWKKNTKGEWVRDERHARYMNNDEMSTYSNLLNMLNSKIKFRP